jgi:hypothetical protein
MLEALTPPPNPYFQREYACSLSKGRAVLIISAPGGTILPEDAQDVLDWLELVTRQLKRYASAPTHVVVSNESLAS